MKQKHAIEVLLRPKVEIWSATMSSVGVVMAVTAPWSLMMTPQVAYGVAIALGLNAYRNFDTFFKLNKYQKGLRQLELYKMAPNDIPISHKRLFLGLGFEWTQQQTQRLKDTRDPSNAKYINPSRLHRLARKIEYEWELTPYLKHISAALGSNSPYNPWKPAPDIGGAPETHGVGGKESAITLKLADRNAHMLVLGTTRVGKTRFAEIGITQDIRRGEVVIVFDPKGDAGLMKRVIAEAKAAGREDDLIIFNLGFPGISARYNGIGNFNRVTEVATRTANQLESGGNSTVFKEFFWRFTNIIAQALVKLGRRPDYTQITMYIQSIEDLLIDYYEDWFKRVAKPDWRTHVKDIENDKELFKNNQKFKGKNKRAVALIIYAQTRKHYDTVAAGLLSTFEYDKSYFDKIVASGLPLLEKLISGRTAELLSPAYDDPEDDRPIFNWGQVIRQKKIVYVGLDALQDPTIASVGGNTMFADLVSEAGGIYKHGTEYGYHVQPTKSGSDVAVNIHADELEALIGDEFIPMLNRAGGMGYQVTAYTQTLSDIAVKLGSTEKAGQAIGNFGTVVMFRVRELATAELLTNQLGKVEVSTATEVTGATDSTDLDSGVDFSSTSQDRVTWTEVDLLHPSTIMSLPKGQAFILYEGNKLAKIRVPLPDDSNDEYMTTEFSQMANEMQQAYRTSETWWVE